MVEMEEENKTQYETVVLLEGRRMDIAMKSGRHRPSFFKVMVGDFETKMRIPRGFIKNFEGSAPKNVFLRSYTGRSSIVSVTQIGDDLFLSDKWWSFAKDHALEYGDFLVFTYNGHADFSVKIFTKTACLKQMPLVKNAMNGPEDVTSTKITSVDNSIDSAPPGANPSFTIVMRPTYVDTMRPHLLLYLPSTFARRYLGESPLNVTLRSSDDDDDDDVWHVKYRTGCSQHRLGKGWKTFVLDNHLKPQDVCCFELLAKSPSHADLKVSVISRSSMAA